MENDQRGIAILYKWMRAMGHLWSARSIASDQYAIRMRARVVQFYGLNGENGMWDRTGLAELGVVAAIMAAEEYNGYADWRKRFMEQNNITEADMKEHGPAEEAYSHPM